MKKFFEKFSLGKAIGILFILAVVLSWIIPYGSFNGAEYAQQSLVRIGLSDFGNMLYYVIAMAIDKILFLLVLGLFYGILVKTAAYQKLINSIAKKLKGKEIIFVILASLFITVLTSFSMSTYAVLTFVPFVINIITALKLDKFTAFATTFGAMLVGILGATYGTEGFYWLNYYFNTASKVNFLTTDLLYRVLILALTFILFNFFTITHLKKVLAKKSNETVEDLFEVETTRKKVVTYPIIIVLSIVAVLVILGFINWNSYFKIEAFNNFHTWLTELTIGKETTIFSYILGNSAVAFGSWDLFILISVLLLITILLVIMYRFSFADMINASKEGLARTGKLVGLLLCIYSVYAIFYMSPMMNTITTKLLPVDGKPNINLDYNGSGIAYFNIDTDDDNKADQNLINQDINKDGKCDLNCDTNKDGYPDKYLDFNADGKSNDTDTEIAKTFTGTSTLNMDTNGDGKADLNIDTNFNAFLTTVTAFITSIFHLDLNYTAYSLASYLIGGFGAVALNLIFMIYLTMYGFAQFFIPTSAILVIGLTYTKIDYKEWLKYIWKFLVGIFICLIAIYILMYCI